MNNLDSVIDSLLKSNLPGLSIFLTGGYPSMKKFIRLLRFIDDNSLADFVEVGIPFSDPIADGVVIQNSSKQAIDNGATFKRIVTEIGTVRNRLKIPLVLMTYLNPLLSGNFERNINLAKEAGFSAVIIPDLAVTEVSEISPITNSMNLDTVFLVAPSTLPERVALISNKSNPFLYYVSSFGVTGIRKDFKKNISDKIRLVKRYSRVPVYCGFGIANPAQAGMVGKVADGIIIGSAVIKMISGKESTYFNEVSRFAINIKNELKTCRNKGVRNK